MALDLFDAHETESFRQNAFYRRLDFLHLAKVFGMDAGRAKRFLEEFARQSPIVRDLIDRSFLSDEAKRDYAKRFRDRLNAIAE